MGIKSALPEPLPPGIAGRAGSVSQEFYRDAAEPGRSPAAPWKEESGIAASPCGGGAGWSGIFPSKSAINLGMGPGDSCSSVWCRPMLFPGLIPKIRAGSVGGWLCLALLPIPALTAGISLPRFPFPKISPSFPCCLFRSASQNCWNNTK